MRETKPPRRALVTLPNGVWSVIDKQLKGKLGDGDSEVIRNIVIAHLTQIGYLLPPKEVPPPPEVEQLAGQLDMQDLSIEALIDVLENKDYIRFSEWENAMQKRRGERQAKLANAKKIPK